MARHAASAPTRRGKAWRILANGTRIYKPTAAGHPYRIVVPLCGGRRAERSQHDKAAALSLAQELDETTANLPSVGITIADLAEAFLEHQRDRQLARSYLAKLESELRNHILITVGDVDVSALPLEAWTAVLSEKILGRVRSRRSAATVQSVGQTLRGLVTFAQKSGFLAISQDPMFKVRYTKSAVVQGASVHAVHPNGVPSDKEVEALACAFENLGYAAWGIAVRLVAQSGVRWGELLWLQPEVINLEERTIRVMRSVSEVNGVQEEKVPKNGKERVTFFYASLQEPLERLVHETSRCHAVGGGPWLFPGPGGTWPLRSPFRRGRFLPAARKAGWAFTKGRPPYDWINLRHFAATRMLDDLHLPLRDVAAALGHSDPAFTLRTYIDLRPGFTERAYEATQGF
jgi:integrase